ncbi:hypothetical protein TOPH_07764 [Tolypocladium ophioglossoides CBS 100239]|uniref:Uncharacterized protein n=1 Tax=Tolypocladium ophioglossoides (strain CBS 100239) TaxID=1163406 RepID=A0A0L0N0K5_TOLOC|nr:hypothetical protein TOPH_07764 [Tolypocladium ophioglossoides CBS 100239]
MAQPGPPGSIDTLHDLLVMQRLLLVKKRQSNSRPHEQFEMQVQDEFRWRFNRQGALGEGLVASSEEGRAVRQTVKNRWMQWGIWERNWTDGPIGWSWRAGGSSEQWVASEENYSRPYYMFHNLVFVERKRIQAELRQAGSVDGELPDTNTRAYDRVRRFWLTSGIWRMPWGVIPGMSWKHEHALGVIDKEEMENTLENLKIGPSGRALSGSEDAEEEGMTNFQ